MGDSGQRESAWQQRYEASLLDAERQRAATGGSDSVLLTINVAVRLAVVAVSAIAALIATGNVWLVSIGGVASVFTALGIVGLLIERVRHQPRQSRSGK